MADILLVANPAARGGAARELIHTAYGFLQEQSRVTLLETRLEQPTTDRVVSALMRDPSPARVVIIGGDGTFAEVARGVLDAPSPRPPIALLPAGTANNHGKSLGIVSAYKDLRAACGLLRHAQTMAMDVGHLISLDEAGQEQTRWRFFDSVGWGWQGDIFARRDALLEQLGASLRRRVRGEGSYVAAGLIELARSLMTDVTFTAEVCIDGVHERFSGLMDLVVSASYWYGGRWILDPDARPDDGLLELVRFEGHRELLFKGLRDLETCHGLGRRLTRGISASSNRRGRDLELSFERRDRPNICSQLDGEKGPSGSRFRIRVESGGLDVLVP